MNIKPIRNDEDLRAALQRLKSVFQAQDGTPEADEMEILVTLIESYEQKHYPISAADPCISNLVTESGILKPEDVALMRPPAPGVELARLFA